MNCVFLQRRSAYVRVSAGVVRLGRWLEHRHRLQELVKCYSNILTEEESASDQDQQLIRQLLQDTPVLRDMVTL